MHFFLYTVAHWSGLYSRKACYMSFSNLVYSYMHCRHVAHVSQLHISSIGLMIFLFDWRIRNFTLNRQTSCHSGNLTLIENDMRTKLTRQFQVVQRSGNTVPCERPWFQSWVRWRISTTDELACERNSSLVLFMCKVDRMTSGFLAESDDRGAVSQVKIFMRQFWEVTFIVSVFPVPAGPVGHPPNPRLSAWASVI